MDVPSPPAYYIYRDGNPADPTTPLSFAPAKGSDELFFALKAAFPTYSTHSERMREAVIQFLLSERSAHTSTTSHTGQSLTSTSASSWQTCSTTSSHSHSPHSASVAEVSPIADMSATLSRHNSLVSFVADDYSSSRQEKLPSIATTASPSMEQMTGVFSLQGEIPAATPRVRRKMTDKEKQEYRKRRQARACGSCVKRKRKCQHDVDARSWPSAAPSAIAKPIGHSGSDNTQVAEADSVTGSATGLMHDQGSEDLISFDRAESRFDQFMNDTCPAYEAPKSQAPGSDQFPWSLTQDWVVLDSTVPRQSSQIDASTPLFDSLADDLYDVQRGILTSHGGQDRSLDTLNPPLDLARPVQHVSVDSHNDQHPSSHGSELPSKVNTANASKHGLLSAIVTSVADADFATYGVSSSPAPKSRVPTSPARPSGMPMTTVAPSSSKSREVAESMIISQRQPMTSAAPMTLHITNAALQTLGETRTSCDILCSSARSAEAAEAATSPPTRAVAQTMEGLTDHTSAVLTTGTVGSSVLHSSIIVASNALECNACGPKVDESVFLAPTVHTAALAVFQLISSLHLMALSTVQAVGRSSDIKSITTTAAMCPTVACAA